MAARAELGAKAQVLRSLCPLEVPVQLLRIGVGLEEWPVAPVAVVAAEIRHRLAM
jgi:hypothetical protein